MSSYTLKIILVGGPGVGKTSLIYRFIKKAFQMSYKLTIGMDLSRKDVEFEPGEIARLTIWDIGGQQRFDYMRSTFYKGTKGALLVFDLTRERTFEEVQKQITEIRKSELKIPFIIIGNKIDLLKEFDNFKFRKEVEAYAEKELAIYIETSAKTGENVEMAFVELTRRIIDREDYTWEELKEREKIKRRSSLEDQYNELSENKQMDLLFKYRDQIIQKSEEILKTFEHGNDFRFLIAGNEKSQISFLLQLFNIEGIEWPPHALTILYNSSNFRIQLGKNQYDFQILFLSNIKKLNEDRKLFLATCKNSDGIIFFYDPHDLEEFNNTANICKQLRKRLNRDELEITLTAGFEDIYTPYEQLEQLKRYKIKFHDDLESLLPEIIFTVLKRRKTIKKINKLKDLLFEEPQLQLRKQGIHPEKITKEMANVVLNDLANQNVKSIQDLIFISYSHKDTEWLERVQTHLKPLERVGKISRWDDTRIKAGDEWREEITQSLNASRAAILLVSPEFLASDFITENELPPLLDAAKTKGTIIIPVIISSSRIDLYKSLSRFQFVNDPQTEALIDLSKGEQDKILVKLSHVVEAAFK